MRTADDTSAPAVLIRLGSHFLDLRSRELRTSDDRLAPLRRQALEVLLALGERVGHVVDKEALLQVVWPDVVVGDDSLVQAITDIRRILGDREQHWLRTVRRRGYMLVPDECGPGLARGGDGAGAPPALSIAVLPPLALTDVPQGLLQWVDEMLADLTRAIGQGLTGGRVIAYDAVRDCRKRTADPCEIGEAFGVRHVLCATMRQEAKDSRLVLVMVDVGDGQQHWAHEITWASNADGPPAGEVTAQIARALLVHMHTSAGERAERMDARTADDLVMHGWSTFYRGISAANIRQALHRFEQAVLQDPHSLRGWAGVCIMNVDLVQLGWADDATSCRRRASEASAQLDQRYAGDPLTLLARAKVAQIQEDWETAAMLADELVALNPANATAYLKRSQARLGLGRFDACAADTEMAHRLSVNDFRAGLWHGLGAIAHFMAGRPLDAIRMARLAHAANPGLPLPPLVLAAALAKTDSIDEARRVLARQLERTPGLDRGHVLTLLQGRDPRFLQGREELVGWLDRIGLP